MIKARKRKTAQVSQITAQQNQLTQTSKKNKENSHHNKIPNWRETEKDPQDIKRENNIP